MHNNSDILKERGGKMVGYLSWKAKHLFPGYFAMVMTTGILSVGGYLLGFPVFARVLLYINIFAYIILWILTLLRIFKHRRRFVYDLTGHEKGPSFFTLVAGTCVFGSQILTVTGNTRIPFILWCVGVVLWVIVMYTFFTSVSIRRRKPALETGINGAWLIAAVGTHSVSVLGTLLSPSITSGKEIVLFFTLCMYFLGCMLYLNIITLIFYRFTFLKLDFEEMTPPYWVNMGAVAITTLAGANLILHNDQMPLLLEITPFLKGFTTFFWMTGTWWIPLLFILMFWRHFIHHYPIKYDPQFWAMAFPLAMYTTSTYQLSNALALPFVAYIAYGMVFVAIIVYILVLLGLINHVVYDYSYFIKKIDA